MIYHSLSIRSFRASLPLLVAAMLFGQNVSAQIATAAVPSIRSESASAGSMPATSDSPVLLIGSGDLLEISVFGAPDFDKKEVRVSDDGMAVLPLIGAVRVSGLTVDQTRQAIQKRLADGLFYNDPQVSVFVKEYATQGVSVLGEVLKPGVYPLLGPRRLFDVISLAGGMTPKAGRVVTITHRDDPQAAKTIVWSNDGQESTENVQVLPGDTILIAKAGIVYVVGDVHKPGGFIMESGHLSVLQAVAMAEGTNSTAALSKARLIRKTPSGQQEVPIDLKRILSSQKSDVNLVAEDIVFVPNSSAKSASHRTLDAIVQVTTGMAVYGRFP